MINSYMLRSKLLSKMNINREEIGLILKELIFLSNSFNKLSPKDMEEKLIERLNELNKINKYKPRIYKEVTIIIKDCILICELEKEYIFRRAKYAL